MTDPETVFEPPITRDVKPVIFVIDPEIVFDPCTDRYVSPVIAVIEPDSVFEPATPPRQVKHGIVEISPPKAVRPSE